MPTTQFQAWAIAAGANVEAPTAYAAEPRLPLGLQAGLVPSIVLNTPLRQGTIGTAMITQFIANTLGVNVNDDGNLPGLLTLFEEALTVYASAPSPASLVHGGTDTGTANAINVAVSPQITSLRADMFLIVFPAAASAAATMNNPATITINNTGTSALTAPLFRNDGSPIQTGDFGTGPVTFVSNGTNWYLTRQVQTAVAATSYFHVGDDTGAVNAMVVASTPPITAYAKYQALVTRPAFTNTGALTVNQDGLGARSVVRQNGAPLQMGDILSGAPLVLEDDGSQYRLTGLAQGEVPKIIPVGTATTLYFSLNGSDTTGNGSQGNPFATPQALINYGTSQFSLNNGTLIAQMLVAGSYPIPNVPAGTGTIRINGLSGNVANSILQGSGSSSGALQFSNCTLLSNGANQSGAVLAQSGGSVQVDTSCNIVIANNGIGLQTGPGGSITVNGLASASGNGRALFLCQGGSIIFGVANVTFTNTPVYSLAMLDVDSLALAYFLAGATFSGTISGPGYKVSHNSVLRTSNVTFPGSAGTTDTGGEATP